MTMLDDNINYVAEHLDDRQNLELTPHQLEEMNKYRHDLCEFAIGWPISLFIGVVCIVPAVT